MDQNLNTTLFLDLLVVIVLVAVMTLITNWHIDDRFDKLEKALVEMQK